MLFLGTKGRSCGCRFFVVLITNKKAARETCDFFYGALMLPFPCASAVATVNNNIIKLYYLYMHLSNKEEGFYFNNSLL